MTALLVIDLVVCALSIGVRLPAIRHYLANWRSRVRRNPESAALALEIGMNCYGAIMGALGAIATHEVRGPVVMKEYWGRPDATRGAIAPGRWLRTGDIGRLEEGYLFINSRARDLILRGAENVHPAEIEQRLEALSIVDVVWPQPA